MPVVADIVFRTDANMEIAEVQAASNRGEAFVDSYTALELEAVDLGRIVLPLDGLYAFKVRAREAGLTLTDGGILT